MVDLLCVPCADLLRVFTSAYDTHGRPETMQIDYDERTTIQLRDSYLGARRSPTDEKCSEVRTSRDAVEMAVRMDTLDVTAQFFAVSKPLQYRNIADHSSSNVQPANKISDAHSPARMTTGKAPICLSWAAVHHAANGSRIYQTHAQTRPVHHAKKQVVAARQP